MCGMSEPKTETLPSLPSTPWQPTRRQVLVVALVVAILYAFAVNDQWRPGNDSALYLSVGRSLARDQGLALQGGEGLPGGSPGLPILIAVCFRLFGETLWPVNLLISAMGYLSAVLAYRIVRLDGSRRTALNVFLLTGLNVALYVRSLSIESDVPAMLFMMAALWCLLKFEQGGLRYLFLAVVMLLGLIGMRMVGAVVVVGLAVALPLERCALPRWKAWVGAAAVVSPLVLAAAAMVLGSSGAIGGGYGPALLGRFTEFVYWEEFYARALSSLPSNCFRLLSGQTLPPLASVPFLALMLWGAGRLLRRGRALIVLPALLYVVMLVLIWGEPAARYLGLMLPLVVYLFLDGLEAAVAAILALWRRPSVAPMVLSIVVAMLLAANLPKIVREGLYMSHHPRFSELVERGRIARWLPVVEYLRRQPMAADEVVLTPEASIVHWLSDRPAVEAADSPDTALGPWRLTRDAIGRRQVRFVVVPRTHQDRGLFHYVKRLNRKRWQTPALTTEHFEVYDCPRDSFIYPPEDYPTPWL
ncbi:MAG TPA: glycosyltransferase family 39 protein [Phycisphaerae bacterium]|nr:glycosyltransferase family 39 protein [Phycisphaerae bacterium]